jgi:hypothetical protein
MGFFGSVKNKAITVKLQGEMTLLDREIKTSQQKFGTHLYTLLTQLERDKAFGGVLKMPSIFHANEAAIKVPFEECRKDIAYLQNDKEAKELEIIHLQSHRDRAPPSRNNQEALQKVGSRISDASKETTLQVQINMLERNIKQRKEKFGVDVFDLVCDVTEKSTTTTVSREQQIIDNSSESSSKRKGLFSGVTRGLSKGVASGLSKLSPGEKEIKACIESAKKDVQRIRDQKNAKQREIDELES